jgi:hypothetical protein
MIMMSFILSNQFRNLSLNEYHYCHESASALGGQARARFVDQTYFAVPGAGAPGAGHAP